MRRTRHTDWDRFWCCGHEGQPEVDAEDCRRMWREHIHSAFGRRPRDHWFFGGRRFRTWLGAGGPSYMNPFVGLVLSKGGGLLPLYVLHLLSRQPRYGNDIMRELEERSRGTWASNPGAIYPLLRLLERHGLLRGEWEDADKRTRRIYQLTEKGRREYEELKEMMQYGLQEALAVLQKLYDELYPEPVPVAEGGTAPRVA
jgi:DNA-binding PadR family transcriptional regulator